MSALLDNPLRLKGEPFGANVCVGDYTPLGDVMDHNTATTISPPQYRFPDVPPPQFPSRSHSPPSSPSDSPSTSTSALPSSANSSSLSLRPCPSLIYAPQPQQAPSPLLSLRDFYLPTLTPEEILDTLDHLASIAPKKKSHARKQPAGHIPRPRNAFILFRCLFVSQQAVPASVEKDHRNISRIAGKVWKSMSNEEKDPWVKASELEKTRHEARWPNYRYNPIQGQALPRRFAQGIFKAPSVAADAERTGRPALRMRPKHEDDEDYDSNYGRPISTYARIGSVPPSVLEEQEREGKISQVASLVREGKKGVELEAAIQGQTPANFYSERPPEFTMPFGRPYPYSGPDTPTSMRGTTPGGYEMSLPPDSPPLTPTHIRLTMRRSSSCPPLPPLGAFPFSNPNPWLALSYTSQESSPSPGPSPFAFSFPPPPHSSGVSTYANPPPRYLPGNEMEAQDEHRPLTAPEHQHEILSRFNFDTSSRLAHRRGSSLDRAIASSSIAGVFGGGLPKPTFNGVHWAPDVGHSFSRRPSTAHAHFSGQATPTEFTGSSGAGTPALSPQSSFEAFEYQRGRSSAPRSLAPSEHAMVCEDEERGRPRNEQELTYYRTEEPFPQRATPMSPATKIPARLFGSQGARLGLDLDLDVPLSLDLSFHPNPPTPPSATASTPYSQNPMSASGASASPQSAYPYTPPGHNFSYTQALMDTDPDVGADEFRAPS